MLKKRPIGKLAWEGMLALALLLVADRIIGLTLESFYFKQKRGVFYKTTYALDSTRAELIILGSSRANHHYIPTVLQQNLGLSTFNTGRDGTSTFYREAILEGIAKRYNPTVVILDITHEEFSLSGSSYDRLSMLLPYYKNHQELRPIIELKSPTEKYKLLSAIYPYNSMALSILNGNLGTTQSQDSALRGYVPLFGRWQIPIKPLETKAYKLDARKIVAFENIIKRCKQNGIKLLIFCSPSFQKFHVPDSSIALGEKIASRHGIRFFDFSGDIEFTSHPEWFDDTRHLNDAGAQVFSRKVSDIIRSENTGH